MIKAVWELNNSLNPNEQKMKFIGIDINDDISDLVITLSTQPDSSIIFQKTLNKVIGRDKVMASNVIKEIMDKGLKGVVFVGRCHDYTHHVLAQDNPMAKYIMGNELHKNHGDKIFQVWLYSGWFDIIDSLLMKSKSEMIGFNIYNSPFANVLQHTGWKFDKEAPFSHIARGFVYIKPAKDLNKNTPIKGFINRELFEKYYDFYKLSFGKEFQSPEELDMYLQENRW